MSFRPTISVYFNGRIADIGYYKDWEGLSLLFEAVTWYAEYQDCSTIEEYQEKRFGCQNARCIHDPEEIERTEDHLKDIEQYSEFPIVIDFTAKCIYVNNGPLSAEEVERRPSVLESQDPNVQGITVQSDFYQILLKYIIPLDHIDPGEILAAVHLPDARTEKDGISPKPDLS